MPFMILEWNDSSYTLSYSYTYSCHVSLRCIPIRIHVIGYICSCRILQLAPVSAMLYHSIRSLLDENLASTKPTMLKISFTNNLIITCIQATLVYAMGFLVNTCVALYFSDTHVQNFTHMCSILHTSCLTTHVFVSAVCMSHVCGLCVT